MLISPLLFGIAFQVYPGNKPVPHTMRIPYHTPKPKPVGPPHFYNAESKRVTYAMNRAETHLGPKKVEIRGTEGAINIYWNRGNIRQDSAGGSWVYRSGVLAVQCRKGFFRGEANRSDVLDYLAKLTGGADPFARQLLFKENPFSVFFSPGETVRLVGSATLNGFPAYILQIDGKSFRGDLMVRKNDNLVLSADATSLSPTGSEVYNARRTFAYERLPGSSIFRLRPKSGTKVQKLPRSAIHIGTRLTRT